MITINAKDIRSLRELTGAGIMECRTALQECNGNQEEAAEYLRTAILEAENKREDRPTLEGKVFTAENDTAFAAVVLNCETDFVAANKKFNETGNHCARMALEHKGTEDNLLETLQKSADGSIREAIAIIKENIKLTAAGVIRTASGEQLKTYNHNGSRIVSAFTYRTDNNLDTQDQNSSTETMNNELHTLITDIALQIAASAPAFLDRSAVPENITAEKRREFEQEFEESSKPLKLKERIVSGKLDKFFKQTCLLEQEFIKDSSLIVDKLIQAFIKKHGCGFKVTGILYQSVADSAK